MRATYSPYQFLCKNFVTRQKSLILELGDLTIIYCNSLECFKARLERTIQ